jgi:selenocysteine lyase/cysteine desulfurase
MSYQMTQEAGTLRDFDNQLRATGDILAALKDGLIGKNVEITTPYGRKKLIYADYVASGRALRQVEDFVQDHVLPYYANSHTEQSFCGARMTQLREEARRTIAAKCKADPDKYAVIFGGSGATTGLNQLVHLLGIGRTIATGGEAIVLVGPYEHHSNLLPWRESGATVIEVKEAVEGGVDLNHLESLLREYRSANLLIGAFSAMANVTGVCTNPGPVTDLVKRFGGKVIWDYAGGAPYLEMTMQPGAAEIDAIVFSPHKFIGGPGASGILIMKRDAALTTTPARPGGGTVAFVNTHKHDYVARLEQREEGGTPNVIGDIRAALAMIVKDAIGQSRIDEINQRLSHSAFQAWGRDPRINLLAPQHDSRVPILSFAPKTATGHSLDYKAFTTALSDRFGIQARGGCSCAGPYVHRLLNISDAQSEDLRLQLLDGLDDDKPGFVRLNLSYLMDDTTVETILAAVPTLISELSKEEAA